MKLVVLYRPISEHATMTETFLRDFGRQNPDVTVETVDVDSREGIGMVEAYDVMQYPVFVAAKEDGAPLYIWQGGTLPLMNEVASYLYS